MDGEDGDVTEENRRLRTQLFEMRSDQIKEILQLVKDHGATLSALSTDMAEVKIRTETLSPLNARMNAMEQFQWKLLALASGIGMVFAFLGWMFPRSGMR
jgi:hypothetical protein